MTVLQLNLSYEYVEFLVITCHLNKICAFSITNFFKELFHLCHSIKYHILPFGLFLFHQNCSYKNMLIKLRSDNQAYVLFVIIDMVS